MVGFLKGKNHDYLIFEWPLSLMKAMLVEPPGSGGTDTFLQYFHDWYNSSAVPPTNPVDGLTMFFREFRPQDISRIEWRLSNMW